VIKAIQSRQNTIERIVTSILERQHAFFCEQGDLVPMRLRDVSELLQVHESTVSRAINEKYLQCKRGIYPLKYFFSGSPSSSSASCLDDSQAVGSRSIKERMRELIAAENPHKPLSDSELANALAADGIHLARRTVAKYRDELGILSSAMRKQ
ncbi:MAG: RNA polymerase sigma-54 factor, partial [Oscillospiraceae bacterium]